MAIGTRRFRHPSARGLAASSDGAWLATWDYSELRWHALADGAPGPRVEIRGGVVAMAQAAPVAAAFTSGGVAVMIEWDPAVLETPPTTTR